MSKAQIYRIRVLFNGYAKAVVVDVKGEFGVIPTFDKYEAGLFEEDKAKVYVAELNKQSEKQGIPDMFRLEKVGGSNE